MLSTIAMPWIFIGLAVMCAGLNIATGDKSKLLDTLMKGSCLAACVWSVVYLAFVIIEVY